MQNVPLHTSNKLDLLNQTVAGSLHKDRYIVLIRIHFNIVNSVCLLLVPATNQYVENQLMWNSVLSAALSAGKISVIFYRQPGGPPTSLINKAAKCLCRVWIVLGTYKDLCT